MSISDDSRTTSSSRISQFGLYRTIDTRTEEFLRLSRKRQIRQGCACAAVSTALTVTVVVSVLLIYEYNINSESKTNQEPARKSNWFGLFNDSASFEAKYSKAKLNVDATTLKLIPLILKTLNHNRNLEKLVDVNTNLATDDKDSPENIYQRNVFSDTRNWVKMPSPKLISVEYKMSPVYQFKNPTPQLDYFTKNRKTRDYQRMLNYFDKMISEKTVKNEHRPDLIINNTTLAIKVEPTATTIKRYTTETIKPFLRSKIQNSTKEEHKPGCKCPKNVSVLLTKLLKSIQELMPVISITRLPCTENIESSTKLSPVVTKRRIKTTKITKQSTTTKTTTIQPIKTSTLKLKTTTKHMSKATEPTKDNINKPKSYLEIYNDLTSRDYYETKNSNQTEEVTFQSQKIYEDKNFKQFLKHFYKSGNRYADKIFTVAPYILSSTQNILNRKTQNKNITATTTIKSYLEAPDTNQDSIVKTTEIMPTPTQKKLNPVAVIANIIKHTTNPSITYTYKTQLTLNSTTNPEVEQSTDIYEGAYIIPEKYESPTGIHPERKLEDTLNDIFPDTYNDIWIATDSVDVDNHVLANPSKHNSSSHVNINNIDLSLRKMEDLIKPNKTVNTNSNAIKKNIHLLKENNSSILPNITVKEKADDISQINSDLNSRFQHDDEHRLFTEYDFQDQEILKQEDEIILNSPGTIAASLEKSKESDSGLYRYKSLLPQSRPNTYLEIDNNQGWKHDELDYDTTGLHYSY